MPLLKLFFLFCLLVLFLKRGWLLGHVLFLAAILCRFMQGVSLTQIGISFIRALINQQNLILSCIIFFILIFANILAKIGYIKFIIESSYGIFP
jgi:L-lactate permease